MSLRWMIAAFALVCAAGPALACKCALVPRDRTIIATPLVFQGRVVKIETTPETGPADQITTMMVIKNLKGMAKGETVKVKSRTASAACGFDFRDARPTMLVGAFRDEQGTLGVRRCTMYNLNR